MIISGGRRWALGTSLGVVAMVVVAGCGSNGTAGVTFPPSPQPQALITGVVRMPNGVLASARSQWRWAGGLRLLSPADAAIVENPSVFPASGVRVSLVRVDQLDAKDGVINSPVTLVQSLDTDVNGRYTINSNQEVPAVGGCGLMAYVGGLNQQTLTRAFVLYPAEACTGDDPKCTDVDVVSETVVRVVLHRLTQAPPVQLCDFPKESPGIQAITDAVSNAVFTATGSDVEEINQVAFALAVTNANVQQAIDEATGAPVAD